MSRTKSAEEVQDEFARVMGNELGALFHALTNEVAWLLLKWGQYRALFGEKETRVAILNDSAPLFFRVVQDVLFEDTLLAIARLVGPVKSVGKPNLTLQRLHSLMPNESLADEVEKRVNDLKTTAGFAVDWRNRHLAHRDLDLALGHGATSLPTASRRNIEDVLTGMENLLNRVQESLCREVTRYREAPLHGDAVSLLYVLRDGLAHDELRRKSELRGMAFEETPDQEQL